MQKTIVSYNGKLPNVSSINVENTNDQFQPWHLYQFNLLATSGIELTYPHEDIEFKTKCAKPFKHLSDKFYSLDLDYTLSTNKQLIVIPHNKYYTDEEWSTPLPVACAWEGWWPLPLTIIFRYTKFKTKFKKNQPFAQIIVGEINEISLRENNNATDAEFIIENKDKYITRKWITSTGIEQDNLYNVLAFLDKKNKLPKEISNRKKFRVIRSQNDQMVQNKKEDG